MPTMEWYRQAPMLAFGSGVAGNAPNIDYLSDTIKGALIANTYTPDRDAHDFWDDVVAHEVPNGNGYTTGGATLASKTLTYTVANSWATQWAGTTAYVAGAIVRPTVGNGFLYRAQGAGTSGGSQPTWPTTIGDEVADGGVTWTCVGRGAIIFDAADLSWANSTITARYLVVRDDTPASDATKPLIGLMDFGSDQTTNNGAFAVTFNAQGMLALFVA
ncbi:MAG: hypothetical protein IT323_13525 [Anaerolineae bacterium]|nr:hypothetical protein [Anaerolineae bacterium]